MSTPEARQLIAHLQQLDAALAQRRRVRLSIRAVWIAGLGLCLGLVARGWLAAPISVVLLLIISGLCLAIGLVYAWMPAPGATALAQMFDREYDLDAQLATAAELGSNGIDDGFAATLTDQARRRLAFIANDVQERVREPMRLEWQTLSLVLGLGAGLALLGGLRSTLPTAPASDLPTLRQAADVQPPNTAGTEPESPNEQTRPGGERPANNQAGAGAPELSAEGQQAADALAEALRDNGATRAAADALAQGDTQGAAEEISKLADQADQLSPEARNEIADALDRAAAELAADQPELADRLRRDADQLRSNDPSAAASALDDLAQAIEDLDQAEQPSASAEQPADPNAGASSDPNAAQEGAGQQGENSGNGSGAGTGNGTGQGNRTAPPPAAAGDEMPLPPAADPTGPTTDGQGVGETTITLPGDGTGGQGGSGGQGGTVPGDISDPATIPPELRDAIQDYFER